MTPGELALAEAARLEAARVYGATSPEHREPVEPPVPGARLNALMDIFDDADAAAPAERAVQPRRPDPARVIELRAHYAARTAES